MIYASVHKRGGQSNVYVCVSVDLWLRLGTLLPPTLVWDGTKKKGYRQVLALIRKPTLGEIKISNMYRKQAFL